MSAQDILTLVLGTIGTAIALATLVSAGLEYARRGRMERMQVFFDLRRRLKETELNEVAQLIDEARQDDPAVRGPAAEKLAATEFRTKRDYLGLFEEVGLAMDEGLISPEVAHYMFGYYALHCAGCDPFWLGVGELNPYWNRFYEFCARMQVQREEFEENLKPIDRGIFRESERAMPPGTAEPAVEVESGSNVVVKLPTPLRAATRGVEEVTVRGSCMGDVLEGLIRRYPELGERILIGTLAESWTLRRYINVYLNAEDIRFKSGFETPVEEGDVVTILPANSGG